MKVSVIIPTYKPDYYLFDCLNSLVHQTIDQILVEVILVLNGPKEPYFTNIEKFINQLTNSNFNISYCSVSHVSAARNLGLELAKGEYIVFIDDDDMVSPNYIQGMLDKASSRGIVFSNVLSFNKQVTDSKKIYLSRTYDRNKEKDPNWMSLRSHMSLVWGKLIPINLISNSKFDVRFKNGQDALFMALISSKITIYRLSDEEAIYFWRIRKGSASRKKNKISYEIRNTIMLMSAYLKIYLSAPLEYNIIFFLTRELAVVKRLMYRVPKSRF